MSQPCPVKLGAFYQCYGSAPATDGMTTTEVNIALDGFAAGERLMRSRMHNVLDQRRREQIAAILLDKRFISRDLVVESIAFPTRRLSLEDPSSSVDKLRAKVAISWHEFCSTQQNAGAPTVVFHPNGVVPPHATDDHAECCQSSVEITVMEPRILPLDNRGIHRLEDGTFVATITTFCATRLHLLQKYFDEEKMGRFYDELMCMCLYFAAISTSDGNVSPRRFETTPQDWTRFEKDNNLYDSESVFGHDGRWKAWDFLREHEHDFDGWIRNAAARWCPRSKSDQNTLKAACRAMLNPLYQLYEPISPERRSAIRNTPVARRISARLTTTPSAPSIATPSHYPLPAKPQFIPNERPSHEGHRRQ